MGAGGPCGPLPSQQGVSCAVPPQSHSPSCHAGLAPHWLALMLGCQPSRPRGRAEVMRDRGGQAPVPALTLGPLSEAPTAAGEGRAARRFSGRQSLLPLFRFLGSRHFRVTSHKVSELRRLQEEVAPDASQSSGGSEAMSWARRSAFCSHWPGEAGRECAQNKVIKTEGCRFRTLPSTREEFHFLLASLGLRFRQL